MTLDCNYAGTCGGCKWITQPYQQQLDRKRQHLSQLWQQYQLPDDALKQLEMVSVGEGGLRDRADMTLHREANDQTHLGLWDVDRSQILDLEQCPQMSEPLATWFTEFRSMLPQIQFGSVRLRVSPAGKRGIWLDFPNKVIAELLSERTWLEALSNHAFVEIGQKRKALQITPERFKLGKPDPQAWFETYLGDEEKAQPLYCTVGAFTQPGFRANRALIGKVRQHLQRLPNDQKWLELGSGIGNFTLPLAYAGHHVTALEMDPLACEALTRSADEAGLSDQIRISRGNMHRQDAYLEPLIKGQNGILADPPRSGLGAFVEHLAAMQSQDRPAAFIYVSCFADSLCADLAKLLEQGYQVQAIAGVDQFPQSPHCEWVLLLQQA